jgi:hypothetical protein
MKPVKWMIMKFKVHVYDCASPLAVRPSVALQNIHLLILQSFDWLAAFHLELLQAILFIAV